VRFAPIAEFLESVPTVCPHELFARDEDPQARASQAHPAFAAVSHAIVNRKENAATETAALIIPAVGNNKLRHETLQRFMLANDSVSSHLKFNNLFTIQAPISKGLFGVRPSLSHTCRFHYELSHSERRSSHGAQKRR